MPEGAVIIEDTQNRIYPIQWQPAIIGRKSMGTTEQNKLLAVDLYWLLDSRRLSRSHAQITEKNGAWFIQRLSDRSGVRVDGIDLEQEQKVALRNGSKITLGNQISKLTFQTL